MAAPPDNITPETAYRIATGFLPFSLTISSANLQAYPTGTGYASTCDSTQYHANWYVYTTGPTETVLSLNGSPTGGTTFWRYSWWIGSLGSLAQYTLSGPTQRFCNQLATGDWTNVTIQPNTTYYLQVTANGTSVDNTSLTLQILGSPALAAPAGSFVIKDDDNGYPTMVYTVDGIVARALDFPAGEWADTVATGETATVDGTVNRTVNIYNGSLDAVIGSHTFADALAGIKSNHIDLFYAITQNGVNPKVVTEIDLDGTLTGNTWTLPADSVSARCFAVNQASTRLYYGDYSASAVVHAYDLTNSSALPDLHAAFGTERLHGAADGFVLSDGSIVLGYDADGIGTTGTVRRFDTSGTVLNTYTLTSGNFVYFNHYCYYDETSFLVWGFTSLGQGTSVIRRILISDGSTVGSDVEIPTYGTSGDPFTTATGFGISNSCPIFANVHALAPPTPALPTFVTGTPVEVPIRRVRRLPVLNNDGLYLFLKRLEVDALVGQGAVSGQGQDPVLELRISRDGGQTFGNIHTVTAGRLGQYRQRLRFLALGSGRNLVVEIAVSDPVLWALYGGFLDVEPGIN